MKKSLRKGLALLLVSSLVVGITIGFRRKTPAQEMVSHPLQAGEAFEDNPLKGFVPFEERTNNFPHSMEWFYLPVSAVQKGMNTFDWSALEERLNTIATRGHQAVFRFYYDYPGEPTGVPQFLIDQGLQMRYYNEPNDLGGAGYCPDYENRNFRDSMISFIQAFGNRYDGDGRIGYITAGLLGFWGEWHNWPYDEDTSDGKADWSISTVVYKEVLDAFDSSFDQTPICVREPKSGIDFSKYDVGFHDDSFGYATLSVSQGGQDWSFMQKLRNFHMENRWKTNCIGGEVYPPSQQDIFSGRTPDGSFQSWDLCMEEAHATWMLCEQMKYYQGTMKENARKAAKQLGYNFRVNTAYYPNQCGEEIPLQVDLKNIGSAPFYYDHRLWPVAIGVKQNGNIVKQWTMEWDLCDVPADQSVQSMQTTLDAKGLSQGNYELCMKVINPLPNGKPLGFANAGQGSDGWLALGSVAITKEETSSSVHETETQTEDTTVIDGTSFRALDLGTQIECQIQTREAFEHLQIYIDEDGNQGTGFRNSSDGLSSNAGFEYLVEDQALHFHQGNQGDWSWNQIGSVEKNSFGQITTVKIPKNLLGNPTEQLKVQMRLIDSQWNGIYVSDFIAPEKQESPSMITEDLEINGFQINQLYRGVRTLYSSTNRVEGEEVQELGLIYGIDVPGFDQDDMTEESNSSWVAVVAKDDRLGAYSKVLSKDQTYAITMRYASGTKKEFETRYYVRAYAKLKSGRIVYSTISSYTVNEIIGE